MLSFVGSSPGFLEKTLDFELFILNAQITKKLLDFVLFVFGVDGIDGPWVQIIYWEEILADTI